MLIKGRLSRLTILSSSLILGSWVSLVWSLPSWSQEIYNTPRVAICYNQAADLIEMDRRLDFSPLENFKKIYSPAQDSADLNPLPDLTAKVEGLLSRVRQLLNACPRETYRLRIFLLADGVQVKRRELIFHPLSQGRTRPFFGYGELQAFYESRTHSIFLSLADLNEGILAHEMAHFVLCTNFSSEPSPEIQEEFARYVELNLH